MDINFDLDGCDYLEIIEGSSTLIVPLRLQFRETQNPFTVTLRAVSIATAEAMGVGFLINSMNIANFSRASSGLWNNPTRYYVLCIYTIDIYILGVAGIQVEKSMYIGMADHEKGQMLPTSLLLSLT